MQALIFSKITEGHGPGGMQRHLSQLVEWLSHAGWQSTIVTTVGATLPLEIPARVEIIPRTQPGRYDSQWWAGTRRFVRTATLDDWDVLISEDGGAWSVIDELHQRPSRPPIVMIRHGTVSLNLAQNVPPRSLRSVLTALSSTRDYFRFARPLSRYIDITVAASASIARSVVREGGITDDRVRVVPIGVDLDTFAPARDPRAARAALGLARDMATLLWVGRDIPGKDIEVALQSLATLRAAGHAYQLILVTDRARPRTRAAVRGLLEQWTRSVCLVENAGIDQLRQLYAAADLELFTSSLAEGTPLVVYEGLASGIPVLCRATPALLELPPLQERLDWFVEKGPIRVWVDRITSLTTEPRLSHAKQQARQLAERYCDQRVTEHGTVAAVREAIQMRRTGNK